MIEETLVLRRQLVMPDEFVEAVALSQLVPGPVTLKVAAYMGYLLRGFSGLMGDRGFLFYIAFSGDCFIGELLALPFSTTNGIPEIPDIR